MFGADIGVGWPRTLAWSHSCLSYSVPNPTKFDYILHFGIIHHFGIPRNLFG